MRTAVIAFLFAAMAAAEDSPGLRFSRIDPLARGGLLYRCTVQRDVGGPDFDRGPVTLDVVIEQGSQTIAESQLTLAKLGQLRDGVGVALSPARVAPGPAIVRAVISIPGIPLAEKVEQPVRTPRASQDRLQQLFEKLKAGGDNDPLPWLWVEQGAALAVNGESIRNLNELDAINLRLSDWLERPRPQPILAGSSVTLAIRDAIDGSVQPYRLHLPEHMAGSVPLALVLARFDRVPGKELWPSLKKPWLEAANRSGVAVVECYPAGDIAWNGIGLARAQEVLDDVSKRCGALDARRPIVFRADRTSVQQDIGPDSPTFWKSLAEHRAANQPSTQPNGRLSAYATKPFIIVYGTGEHAAAAEAALSLANDFRAAWARHAQGVPPMLADTAYDEKAQAGRNIVAVGGPRANAVLKRLVERGMKLPVKWDSRSISHGDVTVPRNDRNPFALAWPHPDGGDRLVVILDGAPSWPEDTSMPLAGLPDLFIGPLEAGQPPLVWRLFDKDWR